MSDLVDDVHVGRRIARWWWLFLVLATVGGLAAYWISLETEPVYEANVTLLVGDPSSAASVTKESIETSQLLATTYVNLIRSEPVLTDVAEELGLEAEAWRDLKDKVRTNTGALGAQSIRITVFDDSAVAAEDIAQAVGDRALEFGSAAAGVDRMSRFTEDQIQSLRQSIAAAEDKIAELEATAATANGAERAEFEAQIQEHQELIIGWQNNYSSLLNSLSTDGTSNSVQVIDSAAASISPVRPIVPVNLGAGIGIGLLLALALAYAFAVRSGTKVVAGGEEPAPRKASNGQPAHAMSIRATEVSGTVGGN